MNNWDLHSKTRYFYGDKGAPKLLNSIRKWIKDEHVEVEGINITSEYRGREEGTIWSALVTYNTIDLGENNA